jgi:hypothetical protein
MRAKLTAYALRLRVGRPIGGASARHRLASSSLAPGAAGCGSIRPVGLHVVAWFGRRRRALALLRGHSALGFRRGVRERGGAEGMRRSTGRTTGRDGQVGAAAWMEDTHGAGAEKERGELPENK